MPKVTKAIVDKGLRNAVFTMMGFDDATNDFKRINDRQYGIILTDANGEQRYVRIGAIVAELREDMTAQELMDSEIAEYDAKQKAKEEKAKEKEKKIAEDKAKREAKKEEVSES